VPQLIGTDVFFLQVPSDFATPADFGAPYAPEPASGGSAAKQEALEDYEEDLMARIERTLAEASRTLHLHSNLTVAGTEEYRSSLQRSGATALSDDLDARMLC
jgi:hypothetical protein